MSFRPVEACTVRCRTRSLTSFPPSSIHTQLPAELSSRNLTPINLSSVFLSGASAGGYLTLSNGQWLSPSPRGLVSLYGYTFSSDFFSTPQSPELIMMGDPVGNVEPQAKEIEEFWQEGRSVVANRPFDLTDMSKPETLLYTYQILKGTCTFLSHFTLCFTPY